MKINLWWLKTTWQRAVLKFGIIPFVLAIGTVGGLAVLGFNLLSDWVDDSQTMLAALRALTAIGLIFYVCFVTCKSIKVAIFLMVGLLLSGAFLYFGLEWMVVYRFYQFNGSVVHVNIPSPWPFVDMQRGIWWNLKLAMGLFFIAGLGLILAGIGLWLFFINVKNMARGVKLIDATVREKVRNDVEHQKLKARHSEIIIKTTDSQDAL